MLRHACVWLVVGAVVALVGVDATAQNQPEGQLTIAFDTSIAPTYLDPAETHRLRFVLHALWPDFLTFYATPATGAASCCNNAPYLPGRADGGAHCAPLHLRCALTFWNI